MAPPIPRDPPVTNAVRPSSYMPDSPCVPLVRLYLSLFSASAAAVLLSCILVIASAVRQISLRRATISCRHPPPHPAALFAFCSLFLLPRCSDSHRAGCSRCVGPFLVPFSACESRPPGRSAVPQCPGRERTAGSSSCAMAYCTSAAWRQSADSPRPPCAPASSTPAPCNCPASWRSPRCSSSPRTSWP